MLRPEDGSESPDIKHLGGGIRLGLLGLRQTIGIGKEQAARNVLFTGRISGPTQPFAEGRNGIITKGRAKGAHFHLAEPLQPSGLVPGTFAWNAKTATERPPADSEQVPSTRIAVPLKQTSFASLTALGDGTPPFFGWASKKREKWLRTTFGDDGAH